MEISRERFNEDTPTEEPQSFADTLKFTYQEWQDLTNQDNSFKMSAIKARHRGDVEVKRLRDTIKPTNTNIAAIRTQCERIDNLIIRAWDEGIRPRDKKAIGVVNTPERRVWSTRRVQDTCDKLGISYNSFVEAANFGVKRAVKIYR